MKRTLAFFAPLAGMLMLATGCTTAVNVGTDGPGGSSSMSAGTSMTSSDSTGSTTTGVGGAGGGCSGASITVNDTGVTKHFDFACTDANGAGTTTDAVGYIGYPSPHWMGPEQVFVKGCAVAGGTTNGDSIQIQASQAMVGTAPDGIIAYHDGVTLISCDSADDSTCAMTVTVTELSSDTIRGSFTTSSFDEAGQMHYLTGTFKVCRVGDFLPP